MVFGEESPHFVSVTSGVPKGSVLGSLMLLIFLNYFFARVKSEIRSFADECVLYDHVGEDRDARQIQNDLT